MSKLTIPVPPLLGAPLTDEELKSIIGGQFQEASRICSCTYLVGHIASGGEIVALRISSAKDESDCRTKCLNACSRENGGYCGDYHINYTAID